MYSGAQVCEAAAAARLSVIQTLMSLIWGERPAAHSSEGRGPALT